MLVKFYSSLVFFKLFADLIMILIISSDNLIEKQSKIFFRRNFVVLSYAVLVEWINIILLKKYGAIDGTYPLFFEILNFLVLVVSPITIYFVGCDFKKTKLSKFVFGIIIANIFLQTFALISDSHYFVSQGVFMEGNLYWIYNIFIGITVASMLISMIAYSRECQTKDSYILVLIALAYFTGNVLQIISENYIFILLCANISSIFLYAYYVAMTNKIDMLTNLLNRRCFANRKRKIKKDCVVLCFDLNKFKEVNDTYGHVCGDEVLKKISQIMLKVYSKYGYCYRIGGDEFCVILFKQKDRVKELNTRFLNCIKEEQKLMPNLTSASIGYSYFYKNESDIKTVIKEADIMLYEEKAKIKNEL